METLRSYIKNRFANIIIKIKHIPSIFISRFKSANIINLLLFLNKVQRHYSRCFYHIEWYFCKKYHNNVEMQFVNTCIHLFLSALTIVFATQEYAWKDKSADEETRKYSDKLRDVCALAERLGCSFGQLAIAWSLKNESVQCLLLGASNIDQLYESLQSLQVTSELFVSRERLLDLRK